MGNKDEIKVIEISTSRMVLKFLKLMFFSLIRLRFYVPGIPEIKVDKLYELIKSNNAPLILDTRDKIEFYALEGLGKKYGHIPGAKLLPIFQLNANLKHLSSFKDDLIVTICPGGGASLIAAEIMIEAGFTNVKSLRGGMNKWSRKGYPTTTAENSEDTMYMIEEVKIETIKDSAEVVDGKYIGEIHKTVDARNFNCPVPVLKSKKALDKLDIGQVLEILTTDPGSKRDIPAWAQVTGQELISLEENNPEEFRILVKRLK
ncbi:MAG: sulfurtransferase TusA family protein [Candidatus Heimdallarchaeota archaeon]|nr:sulfurtransferase TusA family protein [Candidatus Heimdallarchaeota archaeon]MCK4877974.1 sulfurtransferase TusA family protein [Candidatus Heimdallarchaeota archaeon]